MSQKFENMFNLALQTPEGIREKTNNLNVGFEAENRTWEVIVKYHDSLSFLIDYGVQVEYLIAGYAILTVPESLVELLAEVEQIEYVEKPKRYYFEAELPSENACVYPVTLNPPNLSGRGILIAIIDSGIDYRRMDFRNRDGSTRIVALWDQTLEPRNVETEKRGTDDRKVEVRQGRADGGEVETGQGRADGGEVEAGQGQKSGLPPEGFGIGVEFTREEINRALQEEAIEAFSLVPSRDISGHGTAVAGIAAGSRVNVSDYGVYQGVAPESDLLVVKLGNVRDGGFPKTTEIMRAVTYAVKKGLELGQPLVINLSFGNTYGSHDGTSLLERFLDNASEIGRTVICVGAGNEGDSAGHFGGNINSQQVVEIAVGEYERTLSIQLWHQYNDRFQVSLQAPSGIMVVLTELVNAQKQEFLMGRTRVLVYNGEPKPYSVLQETYLDLIPEGTNYITSGIWQLRLESIEVVTGKYDVYLPGTEARNGRTNFLRPTQEMTLTIPSTSARIVTVGAYNSVFEQYAAFSGRGTSSVSRESSILMSGLVKPDIVASGVDVIAPDVLGGYKAVTGTSFATPIVSGSAALLMEWGIIQKNDIYLYGEKIKAYLRRGARPLRGEEIYPNERVGFGKLCVSESIELVLS